MSQSRPLPAAVIPLLGPHDDTTELVNMLHGRPYIAKDDVIYRLQTRGFALLDRIERVVDMDHRMEMYDDFLDFFPPRREGKGVWISRGFLCEYVSDAWRGRCSVTTLEMRGGAAGVRWSRAEGVGLQHPHGRRYLRGTEMYLPRRCAQ